MSAREDEVHEHEQGEPHDVQAMHAPIMRERDEPRDGFEPIHPIWSLVFGVLIFWGGWYLGRYSGDFQSDVMNEKQVGGLAEPPRPLDPLVLGERVYNGKCAACHQPDGKGRPGQYPPLAGSEWVAGSPEILAKILMHGLQGEIKVAGQTFNGNMPGLAAQLSDDQAAAVLSFVRQAWGNSAPPVEPAVIGEARKLTRPTPWTEAELRK